MVGEGLLCGCPLLAKELLAAGDFWGGGQFSIGCVPW